MGYSKEVCSGCGKHYRKRGRGKKKPIKNYCTKECRKTNWVKHPKKQHSPNTICSHCGKKYYRLDSEITKSIKRGTTNHFCNKECHNEYATANAKGPSSDSWRVSGIRKWALGVKERAGFECEICGSSEDLEAHHILPYKDYPKARLDLDNGACLCKEHHKDFHKKYGYKTATKDDYFEYIE